MAEHGEWNRKGATLSDVTAQKEYGVTREFIIEGIKSGALEYRQGAVWGNPYLKVLRSQLEPFIEKELGPQQLGGKKAQAEIRKINQEIGSLKKKLAALAARKAEIETALLK